jgi:hypothetical protein
MEMVRRERTKSRKARGSRRFRLRLPVWYRAEGDIRWRAALTESISGDETVIRAVHPAAEDTAIAIVISLPPAAAELGGCLVGRGCIKAVAVRTAHRRRSTFAVVVTGYRLERADRAFPAALDLRTLEL